MQVKGKLIVWAFAAIAIAVAGMLIWWRTIAAFPVDPATLDYLHAYVHPNGVVLVGAWDAPGGSVLDGATYRHDGAVCTVALTGRPFANKRLEGSRIFRVILPVKAISSVSVTGPNGATTLDVRDETPAELLSYVVEMTAEQE